MKKIRRLVIKFGTENLFGEKDALDQDVFDLYADQMVALQKKGIEVIVVSSGAIKAGKERLEHLGFDASTFVKKDIAGIGARHLLNKWGDAFSRHKMDVAQVWVTFANWNDKAERKNIRAVLERYVRGGIVPIVNENDVICDEEIKLMEQGISENDRLARMVALLIESDAVLFLTRVDGIYTADPTKNKNARRFAEIDRRRWEECFSVGTSGRSVNGSGGMKAKVAEAALCAKEGMRVAVAGASPDVIEAFVSGEPVGTLVGVHTRFSKE